MTDIPTIAPESFQAHFPFIHALCLGSENIALMLSVTNMWRLIIINLTKADCCQIKPPVMHHRKLRKFPGYHITHHPVKYRRTACHNILDHGIAKARTHRRPFNL